MGWDGNTSTTTINYWLFSQQYCCKENTSALKYQRECEDYGERVHQFAHFLTSSTRPGPRCQVGARSRYQYGAARACSNCRRGGAGRLAALLGPIYLSQVQFSNQPLTGAAQNPPIWDSLVLNERSFRKCAPSVKQYFGKKQKIRHQHDIFCNNLVFCISCWVGMESSSQVLILVPVDVKNGS